MQSQSGKSKWQKFFSVIKWVIFPIGLTMAVCGFVKRRLNFSITSKITFLYTMIYLIVFCLYATFILTTLAGIVATQKELSGTVVMQLIVSTIIFGCLSLILFVSIGGFANRSIVSPLRSMTKKIDNINADNLKQRLEVVDSQGEICELTEQINIMLDSIENSFNQQKHFVSDASHELRTPISVILGYAELIQRWGKEDEKVLNESIDAIVEESRSMKRLVEQLLYLAKVGSFSFATVELDAAKVVRDVVDSYKIGLTDKTILFKQSKKVRIMADKGLLVELMRILIDNAIKYTGNDGQISIECCKHEGNCVIKVVDNGIGISSDHMPHIYDRFYRCDMSRERKDGSLGLGLSIAKSIVELMNGDILCESIEGEGTAFTINVPAGTVLLR